jgi:hypothetical protein
LQYAKANNDLTDYAMFQNYFTVGIEYPEVQGFLFYKCVWPGDRHVSNADTMLADQRRYDAFHESRIYHPIEHLCHEPYPLATR